MITLIPGKTDFLATMYSFGAMLSFTIAHVSVISCGGENGRGAPLEAAAQLPRLRRLGAVDRGIGGLGTFAAWIVVMALNPRTLVVGAGWMVLGIVVYVLYRRNQKLPLTETVKVVTPEPLGVEEIEYKSILVGFEDDEPFSEEMVATAVKLASKRRRGIHVHSMMIVPTNLPLDAELPEREAEAQGKIEQAKLIGGQRVTGHVDRVLAGPGRVLDRRRGEADQRRRGGRRAALPQRRPALRQDPGDGAGRAALPRNRRLRPQRADREPVPVPA